ncbi:hypothetical protein QVD17_28335 [Tagetes erecta]|uniref:Bifunctional inhibitor/plant lipid transfer protein/seed storage helical domain-containing protein n=1 Tax=Tagetes erecta TaxID=13708 RepID=A0AAD8NKD5_TARER|nr:hypothetical protein QVD17_28335 [Tagetes erecta]
MLATCRLSIGLYKPLHVAQFLPLFFPSSAHKPQSQTLGFIVQHSTSAYDFGCLFNSLIILFTQNKQTKIPPSTKMATSSSSSLTIIITLLLIATSISPAQSQAQTCASKLVSCAPYLNTTTTPPNTCCDPIKQAVATDLPCLCNLYANPSFLSGIGVNITQALRLPRLCGITSDTSICKNAQTPKGSSSKPPPSAI